jgi:hypothetical protein
MKIPGYSGEPERRILGLVIDEPAQDSPGAVRRPLVREATGEALVIDD